MPINDKLKAILACPKCKGPLAFEADDRIVCHACGLIYPVRDGIPVMLIEEATRLKR
jgi:uncharacterized protein YbaR (Trm112 family)